MLYEEPNLIEFICEHVSKFKLPEKMQRKTMRDLLAWGLAIETLRIADDEDYFGEEEYDFDLDKIRVFQLRVELLGYDVTADVQVREDMTFQDLHLFLNSLFRRDDDHLYRFDCDDGLIANVEPYMILPDRTLRALASSRPRSLAEAEGIPGIGVVKLHAVVPKFLDAISKWEKNED